MASARGDHGTLGLSLPARAEEFPEALSALEIEHILRWSLLNSLRCGADVVL